MNKSNSKQLALLFDISKLIENRQYKKALQDINILLAVAKEPGIKGAAYYYMGKVHGYIRNHIKSISCMLKAMKLIEKSNENFVQFYEYEIYNSLSNDCLSLGRRKEAFLYAGHAYGKCTNLKKKAGILSNYIYSMVTGNSSTNVMQQEMSRINADMVPDIIAKPCDDIPKMVVAPADKIHIAYISPDYKEHVMDEFYYAMLKYHNRDRFFITCVFTGTDKDDWTKVVRSMADRFIELPGLPYNELAAHLRAMNIDIAVELAGHTADSGLYAFAYRVAPVQISGLGWMESTGMREVDYLITDRYMDEPGQSYITEKPLYLNSCFCFTPGKNKQDLPASTGAPCREKGYITFGSFNRLIKITDEMLMAWREIMSRIPNSKFLLKSLSFAHESTCKYTLDRMEKLGMDRERIILEGPSKDYMKRYLDVDIALDTYPYCGGGTTCDALYMGVPVVSLYGKRRSSNFGRSILSAAGLGELAVNNADEYVNLAVSLANDWDTLDMLHKNLRSMLEKSDLMNGEKYTRELEAQYVEILKQKKAE